MELTPAQRELLDEPLASIELSVRATNAMESFGVFTVRDLLNCCARPSDVCQCGNKHLLDIPNFGEKTLAQVFNTLGRFGFERRK